MKGTYCLLINIKNSIRIKVEGLGIINFNKGNYIYIGSALNNLEKRIQRHLKRKKKKHWHVDYLTTNKNTQITKVFYKESNKKEECIIAKKISKLGESINNFGCSDCKCNSHLFKIKNIKEIEKNYKKLSFTL